MTMEPKTKVSISDSSPTPAEPPDSWKQKTTFGFMGFDSTPAGRLVRLADVLRWLGDHPCPVPYAVALTALCDAMPADVMQWLYQVRPSSGYATPVPSNCMFGYKTAAEITAAKAQAMQDMLQREYEAQKKGRFGNAWRVEAGKLTTTPPQPTEPGLPALLKCIRGTWAREFVRSGEPTIDHLKTSITFLAVPLDKAAKHWGYGQTRPTVQLDSTVQHSRTRERPPIWPLESWSVQSSYGTLRTHAGVDLVRLEDVHAWLCGSGLPAADAVYKIFSPFYMACLSAVEDGDETALSLPGRLHIVNSSTWPNGLLTGSDRSKVEAVRVFASAFPDLGHVRFADGSVGGLFYSIAEGALRVWHGAADVSTDHLAVWKDRQERESDRKYEIRWPKDDDLRKLLGRIAVPISTAYELWGWGHIAEITPLRSVPIADKEPENWGELVVFRKGNIGAAWNPVQKNIVADEKATRDKRLAAKDVAKEMAEELGLSVSRLNDLIRNKDVDNKRVSRAKVASPVVKGLRSM